MAGGFRERRIRIMENNAEITKEMLNEIYKHDYDDSSNLINPHLIDNEKIISEVCKHVNSKLIGSDIIPIKHEDMLNAIADILSRCLKKKVTVDGSGLDGKDIIVTVEKDKNN